MVTTNNIEDMNEFPLIATKNVVEIVSLQDAKAVMLRGLQYFIGESAQWLPDYDIVADWLSDNKGRGIMLMGNNGIGKTIICQRVFPAIFQYYLKLPYYSVDAKNLGEYYKNPVDNYELTISRKPIIIDDVGVESIVNDYGEKHDLFSEIVDDAEKRSRLMVITTNLTPDEIKERYGYRTLDRLKSIVRAIKIEGESMRG